MVASFVLGMFLGVAGVFVFALCDVNNKSKRERKEVNKE